MVKKKRKRPRKKKRSTLMNILFGILKTIKLILKMPFYLIKFVVELVSKSKDKIEETKTKKKRELIKSSYEKFKLIKEISGNLDEWEKHTTEWDSTIGIILGARGTGKSAIALKLLENLYKKKKKRLYAIGFKKEEMPSWVEVVESIGKIKNNSHILIDEGGILFSSRKSMSKPNKLLSELMFIARHKNLSILFISQNSSNLEINILRQADYLILKPSSLLQKNFERKIVKDLYNKTQEGFRRFKKDKGLAYIHSDEFEGFISNKLPSFWNIKISKSWVESKSQ